MMKRVIRFASKAFLEESRAKMNLKTHWEHIYEKKGPTKVSWYQEHAQFSLQYIRNTGIQTTNYIIDVGGGASTLVDDLIADGFEHITILDISATALNLAQERLGSRGANISWIEADITSANLPYQHYHVWHDRAVFHFLTQATDRQRYVDAVRHAVRSGGHVIVATFAPDGPDHCSGLEVMRYNPDNLHNEFGDGFDLVDSTRETHHTPFGTEQKFIYCYCRRT
jgi:2-polyprenyl-3-methyl-5-hydroxy-6-metoxy-1,4-benzoquinol methylase